MTRREALRIIDDAFKMANIIETDQNDIRESKDDIEFSIFDIDSLDSMEICISIEINTGITIVPEELNRIKSVNELVSMIIERS